MTRDRMVYKTGLSLVTIATSGGIRLVFSVLVARVFGQTALNHVAVIISAAIFATLVCSPGMGQAVARNVATRGLDGSTPAGRSVLVWATTWHHISCLALSVVVAVSVPADGWGDRAFALALTFGYGCYTFYKAVLYGVDLVVRYAVLELAWDAVFVVALLVVVLSHASPWLLAPMVVMYLGFAVGAHLSLFRPLTVRRPAHPVPVPWRGLLSFAVVTGVGTVSSAGFLQLSQIFAARADVGSGGLFAAAMTLVTPAYLLPRAMSVVLFPAMARAAGRDDRSAIDRHLAVGTDVLAVALLPVFCFVAMICTALLVLIYGSSFAAAGPTFVIMVWATWVSIASVPAVNALSSGTDRGYFFPASAAVAGFLVGLVFWLVWGSSIEAVAWGYLVGSVVQSAPPMIEAWRRYRIPSIGLAARLVLVAGAGLVAGLEVVGHSTSMQLLAAVAALAVAALILLPELIALGRMSARTTVAGRR